MPRSALKFVSPKPANALPLLFDCDVYAYSVSVNPCAAGLKIDATPSFVAIEIAVSVSTIVGTNSAPTAAYLISRASIFLPSHSGVRPTISPATKTAMMM